MSTNNICEYSEQLKNMTKFLLLSIEKDKNILISDVYDFLERMDIIANKMYNEIKK